MKALLVLVAAGAMAACGPGQVVASGSVSCNGVCIIQSGQGFSVSQSNSEFLITLWSPAQSPSANVRPHGENGVTGGEATFQDSQVAALHFTTSGGAAVDPSSTAFSFDLTAY